MSAARKRNPATDGEATQWLTLNQAALSLGVTRYTVLVRALRGELAHAFVDNKPVILRSSVERALAAKQ